MEGNCDKCFEQAPLGYKFKRIHELFKARMNVDLKRDDLTFSQSEILIYLMRQQDHAVNQQELCDAIQVSHPTMIGLINRMEKKELVTRRVDSVNRRNRYIELTPKAREIMTKTQAQKEQNDRKIVYGFTPEEEQMLNQLLSKVYENMMNGLLEDGEEAKIN